MQLKAIMTSPAATIAPESSLAEAAKKMLELDIGVLPVANGQAMVGIVSDRDIAIRGVARGMDPERTAVREIMTKDVFTCQASVDVQEACNVMEQKQVRRLVVVDGGDTPVGVVSLGDIALHLRREQSGDVLKKVSEPG
jgi:CBS domain-containing protein